MVNRLLRRIRREILRLFRRYVRPLQIYRCNVRGHHILLDIESEIEEYRADSYSIKEPETLDWIERYFRADDVVYDIGANVGLYSLFAAKVLIGQCKIFAFEPEALNYAKLSKNIYLNELSSVVIPCCFAVADRIRFETFYIHSDIFGKAQDTKLVPGSALHSFGKPEDYKGDVFRPIHMQGMVSVSIDDLWQDWGLDFPNHLKIDVDGLEGKIVSGAEKTLADPRLKSILIEISSKQDPIFMILNGLGFQQVTNFVAHSRDLMEGQPHEGCVNSVFVRGV